MFCTHVLYMCYFGKITFFFPRNKVVTAASLMKLSTTILPSQSWGCFKLPFPSPVSSVFPSILTIPFQLGLISVVCNQRALIDIHGQTCVSSYVSPVDPHCLQSSQGPWLAIRGPLGPGPSSRHQVSVTTLVSRAASHRYWLCICGFARLSLFSGVMLLLSLADGYSLSILSSGISSTTKAPPSPSFMLL